MKFKRILALLLLLPALAVASCDDTADGGTRTTDTTAPEKPPVCDGEHVWSEWTYHNLTALRTRHCEVCDFCEYHWREAHVFENWYYAAPTCCKPGGLFSTCSICPQQTTHYYTRHTDAHIFDTDRNPDWLCCSSCGLLVLEYGTFGKDNALTYYIARNYNNELYMVIAGIGEIPDFSTDNPPPWLDSPYLANLKTIRLEPGITGIGKNAFSAGADGTNPYESVELFLYKNTALDTTPDEHWNGVREVAQYVYDGVAVRSSEAVTYFLNFIVDQFDMENLNFGDMPAWNFWFFLYDMTGDGQEELILHTGSCEADAQYVFYTYQNGTVREVGRISATHAGLRGISDDTGVIWHHGSQGWEAADRITLTDEGLVRETLFESRPVESYTVFENAIMLLPYERWHATNFSGGGKG